MWLFIGLTLGIALLLLVLWLRSRKIVLTWYEWLLGALGLALLLFSLQNYIASTAELEPMAPGMFLLVFGLPGLVLVLLSIGLPWWRHFRKRRSAQNNTGEEKQTIPQA